MHTLGDHQALLDAFEDLPDKGGLGSIALDTKVERFALAAIALTINNRAGRRIAHVEFPPRRDLVILDAPLQRRRGRHLDVTAGRIRIRYEAKAGQLFDFAPAQGTDIAYMGGKLNDDLAKASLEKVAGLFFLIDTEDPSGHLKYYKGNLGRLEDAIAILEKNVTNGTLVARSSIDCGIVDGAHMRIHMLVFDRLCPLTDSSG